jgi:hypothetical protein
MVRAPGARPFRFLSRVVRVAAAFLATAPAALLAEPEVAPARLAISLQGGAGYANQHASDATYGAGALTAVLRPVPALRLALGLETLSAYDRTYLSTLPAADGEGRLEVKVGERLPRVRLGVGWDLGALLFPRRGVELTPSLVGELLDFANDVFPQRASSLGLGLTGELPLHPGLALLCELSYVRALHVSGSSAHPLLLYGPFTGGFRMMFGAAFALGDVARFELRYQGELLFSERDTRVLDTLLLGPTFTLR